VDDTDDIWDDTPEGEPRPAHAPNKKPDFRSSNEYKALRGQRFRR
jgi:hypothetical protein